MCLKKEDLWLSTSSLPLWISSLPWESMQNVRMWWRDWPKRWSWRWETLFSREWSAFGWAKTMSYSSEESTKGRFLILFSKRCLLALMARKRAWGRNWRVSLSAWEKAWAKDTSRYSFTGTLGNQNLSWTLKTLEKGSWGWSTIQKWESGVRRSGWCL